MMNDIGFNDQTINVGDVISTKKKIKLANEIHLKFVDDLTIAEAIDLPGTLIQVPENQRTHPENYHDRTGHTLPPLSSSVHQQVVKTQRFAEDHQMKINFKKTKLMLFNPCTSLDFSPKMLVNDHEIGYVNEVRLLGLTITSDLKWGSNTENLVSKANKRLWILRRLKNLGASQDALLEVYTKQIRSVLELGVPVWQGSISQNDKILLERVQKCACRIVLGLNYVSYRNSLSQLGLDSLESRRNKLSLKFAMKAEKDPKFNSWFKPNQIKLNTRTKQNKYCTPFANSQRFEKSPISFLTAILNSHYRNKK